MVHRNILATVVLALALAPAACGGGKVKDKTPDDETTANIETPPPTPKKCESLDENCTAKADTIAKVKSAMVVFAPPKDWTYAQTETHSIVQASSEPSAAALVLGAYAPDKDAKKNDAARDAAFAELLKTLGATLPKSYKVAWKKPENTLEANGLKIGVWVAPGGERADLKDKKGSVMIVHAPVDATHNLLGAAFVLDDDVKGQEAVQTVLQSFKADEK